MNKTKTCEKYSKRDGNGLVHCYECPLVVDKQQFLCKMNSHYDRKTKEWELNTYKNIEGSN